HQRVRRTEPAVVGDVGPMLQVNEPGLMVGLGADEAETRPDGAFETDGLAEGKEVLDELNHAVLVGAEPDASLDVEGIGVVNPTGLENSERLTTLASYIVAQHAAVRSDLAHQVSIRVPEQVGREAAYRF